MRILYYSPHPSLQLNSNTGYGTHMREMIAAFRNCGHEVLPVIAADLFYANMDRTDESREKETPKGIRVKEGIKKIIPPSVWSGLKNINLIRVDRKLTEILRGKLVSWKPDLIYERCSYLQTSGVKIAREYHLPHLMEINSPCVEEQGELEDGYKFFFDLARKREKEQAEKSDMLICVSTALKSYYQRFLNIDPQKIMVVPNAINPEICRLEKKDGIKKKLGIENNRVIGFVGSFFRWHRIDLVIKAFNELEESGTKLLIVGSGSIENDLRELAAQMKRGGDIIFTGEVEHDRIYDYIRSMDICVLAGSHWYGSPIKLFEYGAMRKPIIAPDNVPVKDIIADGIDGLLVKPTVRSISLALRKLLDDPALADKIASSFNYKVCNEYTWTNHAEMILKEASAGVLPGTPA